MININKEMKILSNILKHYGNVKFIIGNNEYKYGLTYKQGRCNCLTYKQGRYKTDILVKEVFEEDNRVSIKFRIDGIIYSENRDKRYLLDFGSELTLEIATVENGRIYRTAGLLNLADKVVRYVNYFRYNKIKRFNQKEL